MTVYSVAALIAVRTAETIYAAGLAVATGLGVDTTTWRAGDPTRSTYKFLAEVLAEYEGITADYIRASWLSLATGDWLKVLAVEVYGVTPAAATNATCTVTIKNNGGGTYPIGARDLTFKSSLSNKTYHNVSALPTLSPGVQLTVDVEADEAGSDSSAGVNEIDQLVTTKLGVDILSSTAAVGIDEQSEDSIKDQCRASRGALSPNGPSDAYNYVVTRPELTGVQDITRASTESNSGTLDVTVYVAGPSGPVAGASVIAAQVAVEMWATPHCVTPTVVNSIGDTINVSASVQAASGETIPTDAQDQIEEQLGLLFAGLKIGKDSGYYIDPTTITTVIRNAVPEIDLVPVYSPSVPTLVSAGHVPVLGTVVITVL